MVGRYISGHHLKLVAIDPSICDHGGRAAFSSLANVHFVKGQEMVYL